MVDTATPQKAAAFFDVDGTLADTTIVHFYRFFMWQRLSGFRRRVWDAAFLTKCLYYLALDRLDRSRLNTVFYRNYAGLPVHSIKSLMPRCHAEMLAPRCFREVKDCVRQHAGAGEEVVLVTGSVDFVVEQLARELGASHVIAARLAEVNGVFTGRLVGPPVGGEEKAIRMRELAAEQNISLGRSHAYSDSASDLPMLETVGIPHAVNPDRKLQRIAQARGWPIHRWSCSMPAANGK
jgi:HAD superfamily hydrolase (TIGR01490 family)